MLTKSEILKQLDAGRIVIDPFEPKHLGPNSYDVTLAPIIREYSSICNGDPFDPKKENEMMDVPMGDGKRWCLLPGILYLGSTNESVVSTHYIPTLHGISSLARLGIKIHETAGFGDLGWGFVKDEAGRLVCTKPTWTLEITVVHETYLYPNMRIGQIAFDPAHGEIEHLYDGKYNYQQSPQASLSYKDFQ